MHFIDVSQVTILSSGLTGSLIFFNSDTISPCPVERFPCSGGRYRSPKIFPYGDTSNTFQRVTPSPLLAQLFVNLVISRFEINRTCRWLMPLCVLGITIYLSTGDSPIDCLAGNRVEMLACSCSTLDVSANTNSPLYTLPFSLARIPTFIHDSVIEHNPVRVRVRTWRWGKHFYC